MANAENWDEGVLVQLVMIAGRTVRLKIPRLGCSGT